jgi:peroxiredoxin
LRAPAPRRVATQMRPPTLRAVRKPALLLAVVVSLITLLAGCPGEEPAANAPASDLGAAQAAPAPSVETPASERRGTPLPAFNGIDIAGAPLSVSKFIGKRTLYWGFNPELPDARVVATAMKAIAAERLHANFQIVGFAMGSSAATSQAFLGDAGLDIPCFLDDGGAFISQLTRQPVPAFAIVADADANMIASASYFPTDIAEPEEAVEKQLRELLRLAVGSDAVLAPDFTADQFERKGKFTLSSLRGKAVVLMFFLYTCPHCHEAMAFLNEELPKLPAAKRPKIVLVSTHGSESAVLEDLQSRFTMYDAIVPDYDVAIRNKYGATLGVPVLIGIDAAGEIQWRSQGWAAERYVPLARMRLATLAGVPAPMLLSQSGYSGNDFCTACHTEQRATWEMTQHASALNTLVKHGADAKGECVTCHVVGFGKPGGFAIAQPNPELENVGCETCHGRGGPHLSPGHVANDDYEPVCATCHTPEHSLGFRYASFLPRVSHAQLAALSPAEKAAHLAALGKPRSDLLPETAAKVGSEACASCHATETAKWKAHPHASATPEVGCETCHGGGADHVAESAQKKGTIISLADKCGSCAVTQLCGSCHSEEKEPGFIFDIKAKIEHQRHSDRPLKGLVSRDLPASAVAAAIESALATAGGR